MGKLITLTNSQWVLAAWCGTRRNILSLTQGDRPGYGCPPDKAWDFNIEGACGEMAAAVALGIEWVPTINTYQARPDLGEGVEVKTTTANRRLLIRPNMKDSRTVVLVVGRSPIFNVVGFINVQEAKRIGKIEAPANRPPAYFVTQQQLRPIEEWHHD